MFESLEGRSLMSATVIVTDSAMPSEEQPTITQKAATDLQVAFEAWKWRTEDAVTSVVNTAAQAAGRLFT